MASSEVDSAEAQKSKKLFINHLDQFQGRNIGKYLANSVVGASLEEVDEEEETKSVDSNFVPAQKDGCFEVVGTVKQRDYKKPDYIKEVIKYENKDQLYEQLVECDVIIYDITEDPDQIDEAVWAVSELHSDLDTMEKPKMFILISSVMTWAKSKPLDAEDPEIPFTEDDYRRRKPHPNFKEHISAEKTVIKMGKTNKGKLVTYVVCAALTYGAGENIFHFLFKSAWHNAPLLHIYGDGQNFVPTIHIKDLAGVIQNIVDSRPKVRYLVAKDDANNNLEEIIKSVSMTLGTGKTKQVTKEEGLLNKSIEQSDFDMLLVNLRMDAVNVKENMRISWVSEAGLVENLPQIIKEYKETRKLLPMRACILGPPASGKTTVGRQLCDHYKLHHIQIDDVIKEAMENLQILANRAADNDQDEDDDGRAQDAGELLEAVNEGKDPNTGKLDDQHVIKFFRQKLHSMPCQNQGFILDGFPKTLDQAKDLFASEEDDDAGGEESKDANYDKGTMPEVVVCFEANDEFLRNRIMNLPESVVSGTHNTEDGLLRRLAIYKANNAEDVTVLDYFDQLEIHPDRMDITTDDSVMMDDTVERIIKLMGEPRNYGPTMEEKEQRRVEEQEKRLKAAADEKAERERQEAEESAERKNRQEEWLGRLEEVRREEYELLEAQSIPLRNYLMKHVMPTLTQGLIDCCKVRPNDPIDYLAEFLFQNNPQVD